MGAMKVMEINQGERWRMAGREMEKRHQTRRMHERRQSQR